jgi:uncharacterized membrane protein
VRVERVGHLAYAASVAGLGVLLLIAGDLGYVFQPVPHWLPAGHALAYLSGAVMLVGGLALLVRKLVRLAALVLTIHFVAWLVLFNIPATLARPSVAAAWEGCGLNMGVIAGGWLILARHGWSRASRVARLVFAAGMLPVGISHFVNAHEATVYVPTWFPLRIDWVYLTGAAHIAAGLAMLFGVVPRLAARLEAAQITAFVIVAHIPAVASAPKDRVEWAMLAYAAAIAGAAWLAAATYRR